MSRFWAVLIIIGLMGLAVLTRSLWEHPQGIEPPKPDTVYLKVTERSKAVVDTLVRTIRRFDTVRTEVNIHDTVSVKEFITKTDTLRIRCQQCAEQLELHRRVSDSIIKVVRDSLAIVKAQLAACKAHRPWWALGGIVAGVVACKV